MSGNIKHIFALIILILVAGGFYMLAQSDTMFKGSQQRSEEIAAETARLQQEVIAPLRRLTGVTIDTNFFSSKEYTALTYKGESLPEPVVQRNNPFESLR